jgi:acyl-CoA-binding protein
MAVEYNEPELRKKLLRVYTRFVEDPSDSENIERIKELDGKYSSLTTANDYIASQPIKKDIKDAVGFLYNIWSRTFGESEEEIQSEAKKILEELRKS